MIFFQCQIFPFSHQYNYLVHKISSVFPKSKSTCQFLSQFRVYQVWVHETTLLAAIIKNYDQALIIKIDSNTTDNITKKIVNA